MIDISAQYFYFFLTLPFLVVWLWLFFANKSTRKEQLTLSWIGAIIGPLSEIIYFKDYWIPQSILPLSVGGVPVLIEDVLFGFAIMGIAGVIFEVVFRTQQRKFKSKMRPKYTPVQILSVFIIVLFAMLWLGVNSIYASAAGFVAAAVPLLWLRHDLFLNSVISGVGVMGVMFISYLLIFNVASNIEELMSEGWLLYGSSLDWRIAGIPLTEMVWGFSMGFLTGPIYEFVKARRLS